MLYGSRLLVAALGAVFALPVLAEESPVAELPPYTITSNIGLPWPIYKFYVQAE